jgi:hypothetical protein
MEHHNMPLLAILAVVLITVIVVSTLAFWLTRRTWTRDELERLYRAPHFVRDEDRLPAQDERERENH